MEMQDHQKPAQIDPRVELNKRLEAISLGLFLVMIGGISFIPKEQVPEGVWSIGVGLILLGLNTARFYNGIKVSGFTVVLGILALITGIGELLGMDLPVLAILLILLGANLILKPYFERNRNP